MAIEFDIDYMAPPKPGCTEEEFDKYMIYALTKMYSYNMSKRLAEGQNGQEGTIIFCKEQICKNLKDC